MFFYFFVNVKFQVLIDLFGNGFFQEGLQFLYSIFEGFDLQLHCLLFSEGFGLKWDLYYFDPEMFEFDFDLKCVVVDFDVWFCSGPEIGEDLIDVVEDVGARGGQF